MQRSMTCIFFLTMCFAKVAFGQNVRNRTLSILTLIPLTGKEPANGRACSEAMKIVAERTNAHPTILNSYRILLDIQDEARNANKASLDLVRFLDQQFDNESSVTLSPVVSGPSITCQYVNMVAKHLYITQFSQFCAGPYLVNRQVLPNLYRIQMPGEYSVVAILLFMKHVGKWRQLAIFTYSLNVNEYMMAKTLNSKAVENGFQVLSYTSEDDVTLETVLAAKASGARVFALIYLQVAMCVRFLCNSYLADMRAPHYVFLPQIFCYFTADSPDLTLPKGCTRQMIYEQMKITFWAGIPPTNTGGDNNNANTSLGYGVQWFEQEINKKLNNVVPPDNDQKHLCHDTMMAAIMTLDRADKTLRQQNMTLEDFRTKPKQVATVVNESATKLDFYGIRIGRIKYSSRFELAQEDMWIMQWIDGKIQLLFRVTWYDRVDAVLMYNLSLYNIVQYNKPTWMTRSGQPPKDLSEIEHRFDIYPVSATAVILSFSLLSAAGQFFFGVLIAKQPSDASKWGHKRVDMLVIVGSISLNAGACFVTAGACYVATGIYCRIRVVLPIIGTSIINGVIFTRLLMLSRLISAHNHVNEKIHMKLKRLRVKNYVIDSNWRLINRRTLQLSSVITIIGAVVMTVWLLGPTEDFSIATVTSPINFDEANDSFYDETAKYCQSSNQLLWLMTLVGFHGIILLGSCFLAYEIGRAKLGPDFALESKICRFATFNAITVYIAFLMLAFIVAGKANLQISILSTGILLYSTSTSYIWFYPYWRRNMGQIERRSSHNNNSLDLTTEGPGCSTMMTRFPTLQTDRGRTIGPQIKAHVLFTIISAASSSNNSIMPSSKEAHNNNMLKRSNKLPSNSNS